VSSGGSREGSPPASDSARAGSSAPPPDGPAAGSSDAGGPGAGGPAGFGGQENPSDSADTLEAAEAAVAADLASVLAERDQYLDSLRRLQADFENYRKRIAKQEADHLARAAEALVASLLPVLDACDAALGHGAEDVRPVADALFGVLEREGLERLDPEGKPFDPAEHEAVVHEPGDGDGGQVVSDVMRAGYRWKGRVLRPAMVRVRG
jgi:molecular chaperone GrpE